MSYINELPDFDDPRVFGMHPNTNRALMHVQATQFVDMLATIEPQYRMMISFGSAFDGDAACMTLVQDLIKKLPRMIETGFGFASRHITFENALAKIPERLGFYPLRFRFDQTSSSAEFSRETISCLFCLLCPIETRDSSV